MKKTLFFVLLLVACTCLVLVACAGNKHDNTPVDTGAQTAAPSGDGTEQGTSTPVETEPGTEPETEPVTEPHEHAYGDWTTVKDATCTEAGEQTRTCACGEAETQSIDALGHTEALDEAVEPTCTQTGLTEGKHCSVCNEVLVAQEVVDALGHTNVHWENGKSATCDKPGYDEYVCSDCGEVLDSRIIPATHLHVGASQCSGCGMNYYEELAEIIQEYGYRNEYGTIVYEYYTKNSVNVNFCYTRSGNIEVNIITSNSNGTYNFYLKMSDASGSYAYSGSSWLKSYGVMCYTSGNLWASSNSTSSASLNVTNSYKEHLLSGTTNSLSYSELASCTNTDETAMKLALQKLDELLRTRSEIDITHFGFEK